MSQVIHLRNWTVLTVGLIITIISEISTHNNIYQELSQWCTWQLTSQSTANRTVLSSWRNDSRDRSGSRWKEVPRRRPRDREWLWPKSRCKCSRSRQFVGIGRTSCQRPVTEASGTQWRDRYASTSLKTLVCYETQLLSDTLPPHCLPFLPWTNCS